MLNFMTIFLLTLGLNFTAQARSLHPCTPNIPAKQSPMSCVKDSTYYTVYFHILRSPLECTGSNYYEYSTATVRISDPQTGTVEEIELGNGEFSYSFPTKFSAESKGIFLEGCVAPVHGGFSIGN